MSQPITSPRPAAPKARAQPPPDKALEGRQVRLRLLDSKVLSGQVLQVSPYVIVLALDEGGQALVYKHGVCYAVVDRPGEKRGASA